MAYIDFVGTLHRATKRDYLGRVNEFPKAECAKIAKQFGKDYWDGDRRYGYGGYRYDGRWRTVADAMVKHYGLRSGDRVLDVGCGKAFLLYDLKQAVPGLEVRGIDISEHGLANCPEGMKQYLQIASATKLPFEDKSFDLVISLGALHNLYCFDLDRALREIVRVGRKNKYLMMESYRNEEEKANLLYWQLTCESFYTPEEWQWWYERCGYDGDYSYIFFE